MSRSGGSQEVEASVETRPEMSAEELYTTLNEYLQLEPKLQPRLCLPHDTENNGEVTIGARDGAAHVLRCLKVWFDLPPDVLIYAINLFDRFLTKMKVRPCHVPCITVSCMNISIDEYAARNNVARTVSVEELVSISQSTCTAGDVSRMSRVMVDKLGLSTSCGVGTALHWLRLLTRALATLESRIVPTECELVNLLEIVACDAESANTRPSELALVLLYYRIEQQLVELSRRDEEPENAYQLFEFAAHLQAYCNMSDASLVRVGERVRQVIGRYEARAAAPQRQRLVWRLSERTLKVLRPTERLTSLLPTIEEQQQVDLSHRVRSGSESSENEETSDWPRSPVLPVYCDN